MTFLLQTLIPTLMTLCRVVELTQKRIEANLVDDPFVAMNAALDALELVACQADADLWQDVCCLVDEAAMDMQESIDAAFDHYRDERAEQLIAQYDHLYRGVARYRTKVDRFLGELAVKHGDVVQVDIFAHLKDSSPLTATVAERVH